QAEDGIRDFHVTGVQTCALPISMTAMYALGIGSNIMSLGGIAIAIGAMVDASIVMVENAHKRLEQAGPDADRRAVLIAAAQEVGDRKSVVEGERGGGGGGASGAE